MDWSPAARFTACHAWCPLTLIREEPAARCVGLPQEGSAPGFLCGLTPGHIGASCFPIFPYNRTLVPVTNTRTYRPKAQANEAAPASLSQGNFIAVEGSPPKPCSAIR